MCCTGWTSVFVSALFAISASADAAESACVAGDEWRVADIERQALIQSILIEVRDHRYESCDSETICYSHVRELAAEVDDLKDELKIGCDGTYWLTGIGGLIEPRQQKDGTLYQYANDPARHMLYDALVRAQVTGISVEQNEPVVILTMGTPGSGKSSALRHLGLCQNDVVLVDPDEMKTKLVEYQGAVAAHDRLAADRVHRESSMLAKRVRDAAIDSRQHMCIDGVLSRRDSALELMDRLRASNYTIVLVAAWVPLETAWNRVQERGEVTGRYVPYDFVRGAHEQIAKHQDELMRTADSGYVFDTTVTLGEDPVLLSEYKDGRIVCDKPDR